MRLKIIYTAVLLFVANLVLGQKWDYFTIPSPNKIEKFIVQDSAIGITDSRGNFTALDLQGNKIEKSIMNSSRYWDMISDSILYYKVDGLMKSVKAPVSYAESIVYDSKGYVYTIANDTLWQFDGLNWDSFEIVLKQDTTSEDQFNFPCNTSTVVYYFSIDKKDKLWVTSSCGMGYGITNFWIDLETKEARLRATFGENNVFGKYGVLPFVDREDNKLLQVDGLICVLDEVDLFKIKDTLSLPPSYLIGGFTKDSILYFINGNNNKLMIKPDGILQELDFIMRAYLVTYPNSNYQRDVNRDLWTFNELQVYKNNAYKIDTFNLFNQNDTLNLCYQQKIKDAFVGDRVLTFLSQDLNSEVFVSQKSYLDSKSQYVLHLNLDNCQNILPSTVLDNSVKDKSGTIWYLTVPRKVSRFNYTEGDSMNLYQYVGDKLVKKHEYKDKSKPLSKLHLVDDLGNLWASYYYDYVPVYSQWGSQISASWKNKLIMFNGTTWVDYGNLISGSFYCLKGNNNDVWVVTETKLMRFYEGVWVSYTFPNEFQYPHIQIDKEGTLWCSDSDEYSNLVFEFNGLNWVEHELEKAFFSLTADPVNGGFWVLNADNTVSYSRNAQEWKQYELRNSTPITEILIDNQGRVWFESDLFISRFDPQNTLLALDDNNLKSSLTNLYFPNPVIDELNLTNFNGENTIEIYSNTGVLIEKYFNSENINLQHLNRGLYTIKITDSGSVQSDKFYKE
jgi:hypothetical protein